MCKKRTIRIVDCPIRYNEHGEPYEELHTYAHVYEGDKLVDAFEIEPGGVMPTGVQGGRWPRGFEPGRAFEQCWPKRRFRQPAKY